MKCVIWQSMPPDLLRNKLFPMNVVYSTCCGLDVHKTFLVATIIKTTKGIRSSYQKRRFTNFNSDIHRFKQWLLDNSCSDVCMESTGKYWIPVFNLLEYQINVTIANPKLVKAVKGNKDELVCRIPCISAPFFMSSSCIFQSSSLLILLMSQVS